MAAPEGMWECPGCGDYIANYTKKCPRCGKMKDDEFKAAKSVFAGSNSSGNKQERFILAPANTFYGSSAAIIMRILTWVLWGGGLIASLMFAKTEVSSKYGSHEEFSWSTFLVSFSAFLTAGGFTFWASEVAESVKTVAESLQRMSLTKEK